VCDLGTSRMRRLKAASGLYKPVVEEEEEEEVLLMYTGIHVNYSLFLSEFLID
jgi:hypothetical protein